MAFGAVEAGSAAVCACTGSGPGTGSARRVAFHALRDGWQQDVSAFLRGFGTVAVGSEVAFAATDADVGGVIERGAAPPDGRDIRLRDPDVLVRAPVVER